jgi:hypothetical protein
LTIIGPEQEARDAALAAGLEPKAEQTANLLGDPKKQELQYAYDVVTEIERAFQDPSYVDEHAADYYDE